MEENENLDELLSNLEVTADSLLEEDEEMEVVEFGGDDPGVLDEIGDSISRRYELSTENIEQTEQERKKYVFTKYHLIIAIVSFLCVVMVLLFWLFKTPSGKKLTYKAISAYAAKEMVFVPITRIEPYVPEPVIEEPADEQKIPVPEIRAGAIRHEEGVKTVLIVGEENSDKLIRGKADLCIIAAINNNENCVSLISVYKNLMVNVPGTNETDQLCSVFTRGGMPLFKQAVEESFKTRIDHYVLVNFSTFEKVIDRLGGVSVTLTKAEAEFLRKSNYIGLNENRNVSKGKQILNGDQALGYCRIFQVPTKSGLEGENGRSFRQRTVLNSIMSAMKGKNTFNILGILNPILPMMTSDITSASLEEYINAYVDLEDNYYVNKISVPVSGSYYESTVKDMGVLVPIDARNADVVQTEVFGAGKEKVNGDTALEGNP